jgi:hypothetical protein
LFSKLVHTSLFQISWNERIVLKFHAHISSFTLLDFQRYLLSRDICIRFPEIYSFHTFLQRKNCSQN